MRRDEKAQFPLIDVKYSTDMDFWHNVPETFGVQMAFIQNLFIRCLNSIYYNATHVAKADEPAFVGYCLSWLAALHRHRAGEESVIFPFVRKRCELFQNPNIDADFDKTMKELEIYLTTVKDGTMPFEGLKIRQHVEGFGDDLVEHLHNNIPALSPERLAEYDMKDVNAFFSKLTAYSKEEVSVAFGFVLAINHHDRKRYPTWPPMPKPVRWFAENVAFWWHRDYWKFAPFDRKGVPQEYRRKNAEMDSVKSSPVFLYFRASLMGVGLRKNRLDSEMLLRISFSIGAIAGPFWALSGLTMLQKNEVGHNFKIFRITPEMQLDQEHEGPYPLIPRDSAALASDFADPAKFAQWYSLDLTLTHNVIIRALNAIWMNAPLVLPEDEQAFVGYALATASVIRWHHDTQETVVFPMVQSKVDMRKNMVEHLKVDKKLKEFENYLQKVQNGTEKFDMIEVLELRKGFGVLLVQHLHDEVDDFRPKSLYRCSQQELSGLHTALENHKHGLRDSTHIYPFLLSAHNRDVAPGWPIVPASVKWIVQHVGSYVHGQYWKFAPYTIQGEFQTYPVHEHHEFEH